METQSTKGKILNVPAYVDSFCSAQIQCPDGSTIDIKIPVEALADLDITQRIEKIISSANKHLDTLCNCNS